MADYMLTTVDNPFNPSTQFDQWYAWDNLHGYHTLGLLGRIINTSYELSETDQQVAYEDAVDEIVSENVSGMHRKIEV